MQGVACEKIRENIEEDFSFEAYSSGNLGLKICELGLG